MTTNMNELDKKEKLLNMVTVLRKASRGYDNMIRVGIFEQFENVTYYLMNGCSTSDIDFFTMSERDTNLNTLQRFENADPKLAKRIKGRLMVMSKVQNIIKGSD
jgi:hypothetical protein